MRQDFGDYVLCVDTDLSRDGQRRGPVIAGQQDGTQAEFAQVGDRARRSGFDRIGEGKNAADLAGPTNSYGSGRLGFGSVQGLARGVVRNHSLRDRKSTRLNSSHVATSYAVFCW